MGYRTPSPKGHRAFGVPKVDAGVDARSRGVFHARGGPSCQPAVSHFVHSGRAWCNNCNGGGRCLARRACVHEHPVCNQCGCHQPGGRQHRDVIRRRRRSERSVVPVAAGVPRGLPHEGLHGVLLGQGTRRKVWECLQCGLPGRDVERLLIRVRNALCG